MSGTVVSAQARRRWIAVSAVLAVLVALPLVIRVWPVSAAGVGPAVLRGRIRNSASQPYQGYAQAIGALGLPSLPQLSEVTNLLSTTTDLRTWYAAPGPVAGRPDRRRARSRTCTNARTASTAGTTPTSS